MNDHDTFGPGVEQLDFPGFVTGDPDDDVRLRKQHWRIRQLMADHKWRSLREIELITRDPQASISATMRFFRTEKGGSKHLDTINLRHGLWVYRIFDCVEDMLRANRTGKLPPREEISDGNTR